MKKTTIAAAKKAAKNAVKKADVKSAPAKKAAVKAATEPAAKKAAKTGVTKKTAKKTATSKPALQTTIVANVNVGFGNALYLRGSANGLSWSEGIPMDCKGDSVWSIEISGVTTAFEFKVLINDEYWSAGYNEVAEPGAETTITPTF